jgi:NADH dehydrogenase FAD-containing subunit
MTSQVEIKDPNVRRLLPTQFELTELMLESFVNEVTDDTIILNEGSQIRYGLAAWAAGNAPLPLAEDVVKELGDTQMTEQSVARGWIATDPWLGAIGGDGAISAVGDASCVVEGQLPATGQVAAQQGEYIAQLLNELYNLNPKVERMDDTKDSSDMSFLPPSRIRDVPAISWLDQIGSLVTMRNNINQISFDGIC